MVGRTWRCGSGFRRTASGGVSNVVARRRRARLCRRRRPTSSMSVSGPGAMCTNPMMIRSPGSPSSRGARMRRCGTEHGKHVLGPRGVRPTARQWALALAAGASQVMIGSCGRRAYEFLRVTCKRIADGRLTGELRDGPRRAPYPAGLAAYDRSNLPPQGLYKRSLVLTDVFLDPARQGLGPGRTRSCSGRTVPPALCPCPHDLR